MISSSDNHRLASGLAEAKSGTLAQAIVEALHKSLTINAFVLIDKGGSNLVISTIVTLAKRTAMELNLQNLTCLGKSGVRVS